LGKGRLTEDVLEFGEITNPRHIELVRVYNEDINGGIFEEDITN
tara:strand:+ start:152 stop:283 length:132 start_codon:yes stop_codon:yes gene_type:complete